jgi:hypothetical protein
VNVVCPPVAVNEVDEKYAVLPGDDTPMTGSPKYSTEMLFVPDGGAGENVIVVPMTEYRFGFCTTPLIATMIEVVLAGAYVSVKAVVDPLPLN